MALTMEELVPLTLGPEYGPELRRRGANVPASVLVNSAVAERRFRGLPLRNDEVLARMAELRLAYQTRNADLIRRAQAALEGAQSKEWLRGVQAQARRQEAQGIFTTSGAMRGLGCCGPLAGLG